MKKCCALWITQGANVERAPLHRPQHTRKREIHEGRLSPKRKPERREQVYRGQCSRHTLPYKSYRLNQLSCLSLPWGVLYCIDSTRRTNFNQFTDLGRPVVRDGLVGRTKVEGGNEPIDGMSHHRKEVAFPTSVLQWEPIENTKQNRTQGQWPSQPLPKVQWPSQPWPRVLQIKGRESLPY